MNTCDHSKILATRTPDGPHYSKEVCALCGTFLRWLPKPETLERQRRNREKIAELKTRKLTLWETDFVASLKEKLSPRQQEVLDKIYKESNKLA